MGYEQGDLGWLRRQFVIALAGEEVLAQLLAFKGGNALAIAHGIGMRASLDLDYSLVTDEYGGVEIEQRMRLALTEHLSSVGLILFDWSFSARPRTPSSDRDELWGGYVAEFKLIPEAEWLALGESPEKARRQSLGVSPGGGASRRFRVELSRNEWCDAASFVELEEGGPVLTYSPAMIAIEKLRSLCQQMTGYEHSSKRRARARDFYDIYSIVTDQGVNLSSPKSQSLIRSVFAAKGVPLRLLAMIEDDFEFHREEWSDVRDSIPSTESDDFDFYAEFLLRIVRRLEPLWIEDLP